MTVARHSRSPSPSLQQQVEVRRLALVASGFAKVEVGDQESMWVHH